MKKPLPRAAKAPRTLSAGQLAATTGGKVLDNPAYEVAVQLNPLYMGADTAGDNPLYA